MKTKVTRSALLASALAIASSPAFAVQEVCLINNSSKAIKMTAQGGSLDSASNPTIELGPNVGDQNQCWRVDAGVDGIYINMWVQEAGGDWKAVPMGLDYSEASPYEDGDIIVGGPDDLILTFTNTPLTTGSYVFYGDIQVWDPNVKTCAYDICTYNVGKGDDDVWRLYFVDLQPAPPPPPPPPPSEDEDPCDDQFDESCD